LRKPNGYCKCDHNTNTIRLNVTILNNLCKKNIKKHQKTSKNIKKHQETSRNIKKHQETSKTKTSEESHDFKTVDGHVDETKLPEESHDFKTPDGHVDFIAANRFGYSPESKKAKLEKEFKRMPRFMRKGLLQQAMKQVEQHEEEQLNDALLGMGQQPMSRASSVPNMFKGNVPKIAHLSLEGSVVDSISPDDFNQKSYAEGGGSPTGFGTSSSKRNGLEDALHSAHTRSHKILFTTGRTCRRMTRDRRTKSALDERYGHRAHGRGGRMLQPHDTSAVISSLGGWGATMRSLSESRVDQINNGNNDGNDDTNDDGVYEKRRISGSASIDRNNVNGPDRMNFQSDAVVGKRKSRADDFHTFHKRMEGDLEFSNALQI
jgi:hypothetical protein